MVHMDDWALQQSLAAALEDVKQELSSSDSGRR